MEKIAHIGGGKSSLIEMMSDIIESDRGVVIIEDGKIVHGEIPKMTRHELKPLEIPEMPELPVIKFTEPYRHHISKPKKPNSGLTIGSYKFKSKKR